MSARLRSRRRALGALAGGWITAAAAASWPEFRGPTGQGVADANDLPLEWSATQNVAWKTAIPGRGWSSPVVADGDIWLTTAVEEGRSLRALAISPATGAIVRDVEVFRPDEPAGMHEKNSHASPTPILDGDRVYVHFGIHGTAALDLGGEVVWRNREHVFRHGHGSGGSPALWDDLLVFHCDGVDRQYVAALDKRTGKTRWTTPRGTARMAFSTPLAIETEAGPQIVCPGGDVAAAYDPRTGEEIWRVVYDGFSVVPRPVFAGGLVILVTGFYSPTVTAIRPDGRGDVTASHIAWTERRGAALTPSPVAVGEDLFLVSDSGIASALHAPTGRRWWQARLGGAFSSSPLAAAGRVYFWNEAGESTVIEAAREFRLLARNRLDEPTLASPAVFGQALLVRTESRLYRIEKR